MLLKTIHLDFLALGISNYGHCRILICQKVKSNKQNFDDFSLDLKFMCRMAIFWLQILDASIMERMLFFSPYYGTYKSSRTSNIVDNFSNASSSSAAVLESF